MSPKHRGSRALTAAAVRLARLIGPEDCVLIGGLAVSVHGFVRATDDIDFITRRSLEEIRTRLLDAGIETRLLRGDVLDGGFSCLKGEIDGIAFDVLPRLVPLVWEEALEVEFQKGNLRVVDLDGLLQLKFRAGGPQDMVDVARLVLHHPSMGARARELATAYRLLDRFEAVINSPRIRAQEEAEQSRRPLGKRRTKPARTKS